MKNSTCTTDGCERKVYFRGKCRGHYVRIGRNPKRGCSVDGCENDGRIVKGMCLKHYARIERHGTLEVKSRFQDPQKRFWSKVEKTDTCWNWIAAKNQYGYGMFGVGGRNRTSSLAHRFSWTILVGEIPAGKEIDHICHNHACVNPDHLRVVTSKQNHEHKKGAQSNSRTGIRGVSWDESKKKWRATVTHNYKHYHVGRYDSIEEANAAVVAKRLELFTHNDLDRRAA